MTDALRDFDALLADVESKPFRMVGKDYVLPPEMPHGLVLYIAGLRAKGGPDREPDPEELRRIASLIMGTATIDEWIGAGVGLTRLTAFVDWAIRTMYDVTDPTDEATTDDDEGEAGGVPNS